MGRFGMVGLVLGAWGCAKSTSGDSVDAHTITIVDAGVDTPGPDDPDAAPGTPDAHPADAAFNDAGLRVVTLAQADSLDVHPNAAVGCFQSVTHFTTENSYYRVFRPSEHGVTGELLLTSIDFGVELAYAGMDIEQPATINVYGYGNAIGTTLSIAQMSLIDSLEVLVPDAELTVFTAPITGSVPPGTNFVVEIQVPDGTNDGNLFLFGTNDLGQLRAGYLRAPASGCAITQPTSYSQLGFPDVHLVLQANGVTTP